MTHTHTVRWTPLSLPLRACPVGTKRQERLRLIETRQVHFPPLRARASVCQCFQRRVEARLRTSAARLGQKQKGAGDHFDTHSDSDADVSSAVLSLSLDRGTRDQEAIYWSCKLSFPLSLSSSPSLMREGHTHAGTETEGASESRAARERAPAVAYSKSGRRRERDGEEGMSVCV